MKDWRIIVVAPVICAGTALAVFAFWPDRQDRLAAGDETSTLAAAGPSGTPGPTPVFLEAPPTQEMVGMCPFLVGPLKIDTDESLGYAIVYDGSALAPPRELIWPPGTTRETRDGVILLTMPNGQEVWDEGVYSRVGTCFGGTKLWVTEVTGETVWQLGEKPPWTP